MGKIIFKINNDLLCSKDDIQRERFLQPMFDSVMIIPGTKKMHTFIPIKTL